MTNQAHNDKKLNEHGQIKKYRQKRQISGSGETADASKYDKGTNPTPDQGEEVKGENKEKRGVNKRHKRTEIVELHTKNRYFKDEKLEVCAVLGLLSKKKRYWNGF